MNKSKNKDQIVGKLFSFYPVILTDDGEGCEDIETAWQWKFFGWFFYTFAFVNGFCCWVLGVKEQFPIKLDDENYKKLNKNL